MFTNPEFEDTVDRFSLRFRRRELEAAFQKHKAEDYTKGKITVFLVLATQVVIATISLFRIFIPPTLPTSVTYSMCYLLLYYVGAVCELAIYLTKNLQCMRTVLPCILSFFISALLSNFIDTYPTFRPAYYVIAIACRALSIILMEIMYCMLYTPGWRTGALTYIIGSAVWIIVITWEFASKVHVVNMTFPLATFGIGLWVTPLLFYCLEKKERRGYFLQWKISHVYLSRCELS
ncbi:MAG: hypothetical protein P4M11_07215 [Candidatus Pacebacteria bacterium]|nr:hypothetical protein [Candidatus Paceibacterota bacterium]